MQPKKSAKLDKDGEITLISDEACAPYCRPMISHVLEGAIPPEKLPVRPADFYKSLNIKALLGTRVTGIDTDAPARC